MTAGAQPFTVKDLETLPEDGNRYEVIEGNCMCRTRRSPSTNWYLVKPPSR